MKHAHPVGMGLRGDSHPASPYRMKPSVVKRVRGERAQVEGGRQGICQNLGGLRNEGGE